MAHGMLVRLKKMPEGHPFDHVAPPGGSDAIPAIRTDLFHEGLPDPSAYQRVTKAMILVKTLLAPSGIHGFGLFAAEFIPAKTIVWEFREGFDLVLTPEAVEALPPAARAQMLHYAYISKSSGNYILCADDARFFNHAVPANTHCFVPEQASSPEALICIAVRDIPAGEELTNDYSEFDASPGPV